MGFCEEVVCINTCCKHSSDLTNIRVRFNGCCKNDHICFLKDLFVVDQVRSLYKKASVRLWNNFSYLAFDVVYAVLFYGSSVELIEVFTWSTDINIEYGYICIRIFITDQHCMFCCVHTADLGAVWLSSVIRTSASHTLDKYQLFRSLSVGKTL